MAIFPRQFDVSQRLEFRQDKTKLKKALRSFRNRFGVSGGGYPALLLSLKRLSEDSVARPIIIFQASGGELAWLRPVSSHPPPPFWSRHVEQVGRGYHSIADIYEAAVKSGATIYAVIPRLRLIGLPSGEQLERVKTMYMNDHVPTHPGNLQLKHEILKKDVQQNELSYRLWTQTTLAKLAQLSGGWTAFLEEPSQAEGIYSRILSNINSGYIVGYQMTNNERDGKPRRVLIEVRGHPEYKVLQRWSFYAPRPE